MSPRLGAALCLAAGLAGGRVLPRPSEPAPEGVAFVVSAGRTVLAGPEGAHTHAAVGLQLQGCPACARVFQGGVVQIVNARLAQLAQAAQVSSGGAR